MASAEQSRRWRQKRKKDGVCCQCRQTAVIGTASCSFHLRQNRIRMTIFAYGLTEEQYAEILARQGGRCAMCEEIQKLVIDHDHISGKVRGLLCISCNTGLNFVERPQWLDRALKYLKVL